MSVVFHHTLPPLKKYLKPNTIEEAVSLLSQYGKDAKILAGGTDLLVLMRSRKIKPKYIIDINSVQEANGINFENGSLKIGAVSKLRDAELSEAIRQEYHLLHDAVSQMASVQIRNMGTVVGNICRASPSADTLTPLLVLEASIEIASRLEKKTAAIESFFTGPGETILKPSEMVTCIRIPRLPKNTASSFLRITRVAADLAKVSVATIVTKQSNNSFKARIALGGVAPTAIRAKQAESFLNDKPLNSSVIEEAAKLAAQECQPITDVRSTKEYRRHICQMLVSKSLSECLKRFERNGDEQ